MTDKTCEAIQIELSIAHDERRPVSPEVAAHVAGCEDCLAFAAEVRSLDQRLARQRFDRTPDITGRIMGALGASRRQWWSVAAAALVGLVAGAVIGGVGTRLETSRAQDLDELFHAAGTELGGMTADLIVVERGFHDDVPERVYVGSIAYVAPERLSIELLDTTEYPDDAWTPNDVRLGIADGEMLVVAGSACPIAGMPECLAEPSTRALDDLPPFDNGVVIPLEIVGPGRSLVWPSGVEVLGHQDHGGRSAIQVSSTVAAVEIIDAVVGQGAWRDFHPTDPVVMWLDEETLVPLRIEVFPADSTERELWQLRRGYDDAAGSGRPILIVELSDVVTEPPAIDVELPADSPSNGFVDGPVTLPEATLPSGFLPHRQGHRPLGEGGVVEVATWSDGRSWLMIETTVDWDEPRLFGMALPFVQSVDLGEGSVAYMAPSGSRLALHGDEIELVLSGSLPVEMLLEVAASLEIRGLPVPGNWLEAATVDLSDLPAGSLVPTVEGWSTSARLEDGQTSILMSSGGSRSVLIVERQGELLDPPVGPDVYEVEVRGREGRYDAATGTLEWVEDGLVVALHSDTVGRAALVDIAASLRER